MKKYWGIYLIGVSLTVAALIVEENTFFALFFGLEVLFPLVLLLAIRLEARHLHLALHMPESVVKGQQPDIRLQVQSSGPLIAAGLIRLQISITNVLYEEVWNEEIRAALHSGREEFVLGRKMDQCGCWKFIGRQARVYDVFGLCYAKIELPGEQQVIVYPSTVALSLLPGRENPGRSQEGEVVLEKKGDDQSEVFDLRNYHPGDDVRSIHWKMSSKVGSMLVREPSSTRQMDMLVCLDIGRETKRADRELEDKALALGVTVSRMFIQQHIVHLVSRTDDQGMIARPIEARSDWMDMLTELMVMPLAKRRGSGLQILSDLQKSYRISRMIYITVEDCPDEVLRLHRDLEITVLCLCEEGQNITYTRQENGNLLMIPRRLLDQERLNIYF